MAGPAIKLTMLFQLRTVVSSPNYPGGRIAGWSESWYFPGTNIQTALQAAQGPGVSLLQLRAALLPTGASIVGLRVQVVDPAGLAQSLSVNYPGASAQLADTPQTALLLRVPGLGVRNIRRVMLRGIPDVNIVEGEYQPAGGFAVALSSFIGGLAAWQFRGRDLSQVATGIINITSAGLVTCVGNLTFAVGNMVRILKSKDASGNLRGGKFQVSAIGPLNNQVTLYSWPWGATTGGSIRSDQAFVYASVDTANTSVGRAVIKKVGRPFTQYRGRRSRKR